MKLLILALCALQSTAFTVITPKSARPSLALDSFAMQPTGGKTPADHGPGETVYGNTLRTWQMNSPDSPLTQIVMRSSGRPMYADIELWIGPDWNPFMMKAYSQDGQKRPISTLIGQKQLDHSISVKNTGADELPFDCNIRVVKAEDKMVLDRAKLVESLERTKVQGDGAIYSVTLEPEVERAQVHLETDGMKLEARVEVLNAPNNVKQVFEFHTNAGALRPFYTQFECPGAVNVIRIKNKATVEFPCYARVAPV